MNQQNDTFEAYVKGGQAPDARRAFEARLKEDAVLAREFEDFRSLFDLVRMAGEQHLKAKLTAIHGEVHADGGRSIHMVPRRWLAIAASLVLTIGAAYYFLGKSDGPQELFAENMAPYSGPDRVRSGDASASDPWMRFAERYNAARYDEALIELGVAGTVPIPDYLRAFYRGQCLLLKRVPDPRAAIAAFQQVLDADNDMHSTAHWYIGLAALKANDVPTARTHFETLVSAGEYKQAGSKRILEQLPDP